MIVQDMHVKTFHLTLLKRNAKSFELPSSIFESDHIRKLTILGEPRCVFKSPSTTQLKHLQILSLTFVYIPEHILDSILSNCLLLERVTLSRCKGFTRIKVFTNNNHRKNLTAFSFRGNDDVTVEIGDHISTLETIKLKHCSFSDKPLEYASLRRLSLRCVKMLSESFSCNLYSLEELKLDECTGIVEFKLSSRSMKRLRITNISRTFKATIDAPSIVSFNYEGVLPQSISFEGTRTLNSDKLWKSNINLYEPSYCFKELYGLLKALSQSEISLALDQAEIHRFRTQLGSTKNEEAKHELPVVVENLMIEGSEEIMHSSAASFLNMLCHMFRPSFVLMDIRDVLIVAYNQHRKIADLLFKERDQTGQSYSWPRDLEGASLQVLHRNQSEWEHTSFAQLRKKGADGRELELRIRLTWRGSKNLRATLCSYV